jgi:hypothetical protein
VITVLRWQRILIMILATADLMVFSRLTLFPLMAISIGTVVMLLGVQYSYRLASVIGMLVVAIAASASVTVPSLLTIGELLTVIIGLLLPLMMLIWIALSAEEGDTQHVAVVRRAAYMSVAYSLACLWTTPLVVLAISLFSPSVAMSISTLGEISIMMVATIAGGLLVLRRKPRILTPSEQASTGRT